MSIEGIIVGLLAIVIGLAWAFYGLKLFTILLPIWAFFFGLIAGAQWGVGRLRARASSRRVLSWGIGLVFGLVLAAISFFWYYAAIVILGGAVGYSLGVGFFECFGFGTGVDRVRHRPDRRRDLRHRDVPARRAGPAGHGLLGVQRRGRGRQRRPDPARPDQARELDDGIFGSLFTNGILGTVAWLVLGAARSVLADPRRRHDDHLDRPEPATSY